VTLLVEAIGITKTHILQTETIAVLRGVDLRIAKGGFVAIMGASGSGKSTLLNIIGCLDRPTAGSYLLDGIDVRLADDDRLSRLRSQHIGFVFQTFNLVEDLTVAENVALPFQYRDSGAQQSGVRVQGCLEQVGLAHRLRHRPAELSGGEMQRVAIARAMAVQPKLILADEPTGNLDSSTSREIMQLFQQINAAGSTLILVTHDPWVASQAHCIITISDGRVVHGPA
jgi:putative ABC transport system ATP-binding protein